MPGNHDVGFFERQRLPARLDAFRATWGADRFVVDADGWRLIGVDVYTVGDDEADAGVASALDDDRPIALFIHQPLAGEPKDGWQLPDEVLARCDELLAEHDVRVIASGHRHCRAVRAEPGGATHVWAPSTTLVGSEPYHEATRPPGRSSTSSNPTALGPTASSIPPTDQLRQPRTGAFGVAAHHVAELGDSAAACSGGHRRAQVDERLHPATAVLNDHTTARGVGDVLAVTVPRLREPDRNRPAGPSSTTSPSIASPPRGGLRSVRWLPRPTCVAPLLRWKSSSIHAVCMLSVKFGSGSGTCVNGESMCHPPLAVLGPTALTLTSSSTASTPSWSSTTDITTGCSTRRAKDVSLLIRLKIRCERPPSNIVGMWMKLMQT